MSKRLMNTALSVELVTQHGVLLMFAHLQTRSVTARMGPTYNCEPAARY